MKSIFYMVLTVLFLFFLIPDNYGQRSNIKKETIAVYTKDGNVFIGKLMKETKTYLRLRTGSVGNVTIKKKEIKSIDFDYHPQDREHFTKQNKMEKYRDYASKYFLSTSGYNMRKGESYFGNTWLFFDELNYGLTNNFSIGAGMIPGFLLGDAPTFVWLKTKLTYPVVENTVNISGGVMGGMMLGNDIDDEVFPLWFYLATTIGSKDKNITIGVNNIYAEGEFSPVFFTISAKYKISRRTYIMSENYFGFSEGVDEGILSISGFRTMFRGITIDYGAFIPVGFDFGSDFFILPYLGVKVGIGKK